MDFGSENINYSQSNRYYTVVQDTSQQGTQETYAFATPSYEGYRTISMDQDNGFKELNSNNYVPSIKPSPLLRQDSVTQVPNIHSNHICDPQVGSQRPIDMATHPIPEEESNMLATHPSYVTPMDSAPGHNTAGVYSENPGIVSAFPEFDPDINDYGQQMNVTSEDMSLVDLRQVTCQDYNSIPSILDYGPLGRRFSESTWSISSAGAAFDTPSSYEEFPPFEPAGFVPEHEAWQPTEAHVDTLSPLPSPAKVHRESMRSRSGSRSRISLSHGTMRASPYSVDSGRLKRWSTGTCTQSPAIPTSYGGPVNNDGYYAYGNISSAPRSVGQSILQKPGSEIVNTYPRFHGMPVKNLASLLSQQAPVSVKPFQPKKSFILESNSERHLDSCAAHSNDDSRPPDLLSTLHESPSSPPEEDMNPSDPEMRPYEQEPRFAGDLYTPRWVRGHGNKREGWCGLCKPGRWLVLKNSAFWYDKSFTHGVSAATGAAFQTPQDTRRTDTNPDVWEGLCGSCGEWVALVSSKKKGTTWFRHAYKCHTHLKVKDSPKRRRESSSAARARAASSVSVSSLSALPIKESDDATPTPESQSSEFQPAAESVVNASLSSMSINPVAQPVLPPSTLISTLPEEQSALMAPPPFSTSMTISGYASFL